jgi:hypothetical protein
MKMTEQRLIQVMRKVYTRRLIKVLNEVDVFDSRGNMILGKGLKVRHKDSQYEYTVDDVFTDDTSGKEMIKLKLPDEPRFSTPPEDEDEVMTDQQTDKVRNKKEGNPEVLGEQDPISPPISDPEVGELVLPGKTGGSGLRDEEEIPGEEEIFVIDREEFEKEYEVK